MACTAIEMEPCISSVSPFWMHNPANDHVADTLTHFNQDWHCALVVALPCLPIKYRKVEYDNRSFCETLPSKHQWTSKKYNTRASDFFNWYSSGKQASNVQYRPILSLSKYYNYVFSGVWWQDFLETLSCWSLLYRRSLSSSFLWVSITLGG